MIASKAPFTEARVATIAVRGDCDTSRETAAFWLVKFAVREALVKEPMTTDG